MKFNTKITTRNWNNGWVDVNVRMPKEGDSCYILYKATLIDFDPKTLKSTWVKKINDMGQADYKNGRWTDFHADYGCDRCWNQTSHDFLNDYYYDPASNSTPCYGTSPNGETIITCADSEIIDSDIFELNPNRLYQLSRTHYPKEKDRVQSVDFEILAWCSIPDEPINPFDKENEDA